MKKIVIFFIFFMCLFCCIAHADNLKELTYRNIPWGTSIDNIYDPAPVYSFDSDMPWEESFYIVPNWRSIYDTEYQTGFEGVVIGSSGYKVGGYALSRINVYCMYGIIDGKLSKKPSDSELFAVDYVFDVIDTKAAYNNLLSKLTELYGQGITTEETAQASNSITQFTQVGSNTLWNGANDTHILLYAAWIDDEEKIPDSVNTDELDYYKFVYITYYKGGINEKLKIINKMEEQLEREQEMMNNEGFDGL